MNFEHDEEEEEYKIYDEGEVEFYVPEEVASEIDVGLSNVGKISLNQITLYGSEDSSEHNGDISRADMPEIPDGSNLQTQSDSDFYARLVENSSSQPAQYRRAIRMEGQISRPEFDDMAEDMGYNLDAGAHNASLLMLARIGEIRREGRGDNQTIRWIGE